jgi:hypothetical protein
MDWTVPGSIPVRGKSISQPLIQWLLGFSFLEVKRPGNEDDHSHPANFEVENVWSYTLLPPYITSWRLQGQLPVSFTFAVFNKSHVHFISHALRKQNLTYI